MPQPLKCPYDHLFVRVTFHWWGLHLNISRYSLCALQTTGSSDDNDSDSYRYADVIGDDECRDLWLYNGNICCTDALMQVSGNAVSIAMCVNDSMYHLIYVHSYNTWAYLSMHLAWEIQQVILHNKSSALNYYYKLQVTFIDLEPKWHLIVVLE